MYITPNFSPTAQVFARRCVARGTRWLDRRARTDSRFKGWRLEMINIRSGQVSSVVHMEYDTNHPLALACKWDNNLSYPNGWVSCGPIKHFGFDTGIGRKRAFLLGFNEGPPQAIHLALQLNIDIIEYCSALNVAWAEALAEYRTEERPYVGFAPHLLRRAA